MQHNHFLEDPIQIPKARVLELLPDEQSSISEFGRVHVIDAFSKHPLLVVDFRLHTSFAQTIGIVHCQFRIIAPCLALTEGIHKLCTLVPQFAL